MAWSKTKTKSGYVSLVHGLDNISSLIRGPFENSRVDTRSSRLLHSGYLLFVISIK